MTVAGEAVDRATLRPGQSVVLGDELVLLVVERELDPTPPAYLGEAGWTFPFGAADPHGLVGESPAAWTLRDRVAFVAKRGMHVLLEGESGAGKEIAARAIHALSPRAGRPLVSRNAATLPAALIDAELFGHARNYPQGGMPERAGLVGEADGGTLFLDEIAELGSELQAHLLRLLDDGEYQRLGESVVRKSDLRVLAATNRMRDALKHDFAARLKISILVPGLGDRLEDVPLLARHLVQRLSRDDVEVRRFLRSADAGETLAIDPRFVDKLLRHRWTLHVRELESLLWTSIASSRGDVLTCTDEVESRLDLAPSESDPGIDPMSLTADRVRDALRAAGGNQSKAFRDLGLRSRDQLYRLMKKLGIRPTEE
jgi:two-component system nitrogen regulation response regulator GlnG/two-component system response regulator HydG